MRLCRILTESDAVKMAEVVRRSDWKEGLARTRELTGTIKKNKEILQHKLISVLGKYVVGNPVVSLECIPKSIYGPKFSRYDVGDRYHLHTDAPWMGDVRTDVSCTIWLNDDYEGGELVIDGKKHKYSPGLALLYECGVPHEVLPVTEGERICAITWIQSKVRDPCQRRLITDYRRFIAKLENNPDLFIEGGRFNSALLRMWSE